MVQQIEDFLDSKLNLIYLDLIFCEEDVEKVDILYQDILNIIYKGDKSQIESIIAILVDICKILIKDPFVFECFNKAFEKNLVKYNYIAY